MRLKKDSASFFFSFSSSSSNVRKIKDKANRLESVWFSWPFKDVVGVADDAFGNNQVCQHIAIAEGPGTDVGDAVWNLECGQFPARPKRLGSNAGDAVGNLDVGQTFASKEGRLFNAGDAIGNHEIGQGASCKCVLPDVFDATPQRDFGQVVAIEEFSIFDDWWQNRER